MNPTFEINRTSRKIILKFLKGFTIEQLNKIPEGHNNNLIWNIAHIIVVQQMLIYKLSGLPMLISDEMVEKYKKGSKPEHIVTQAELDEIEILLLQIIDKTQTDYNNGVFQNFEEYPTSTGYTLNTVSDALYFNNFHEGLHIGIMMSLKKFV